MASAARREHAASSRVSPPPERQPAQWRWKECHANAGCALEVTARTSHHSLSPKERGLPPALCPFYSAGGDRRQRGTARARQACVFRPIPRHSQRSGACASVVTRKPAVRWRAQLARRTGLAPKEGGLIPVQCPFISHGSTTTSAARRAHAEAHVFRHLPRDSRRSGAGKSATRMPAARWRQQLVRRTTALHGRREASCRCSALSYRLN